MNDLLSVENKNNAMSHSVFSNRILDSWYNDVFRKLIRVFYFKITDDFKLEEIKVKQTACWELKLLSNFTIIGQLDIERKQIFWEIFQNLHGADIAIFSRRELNIYVVSMFKLPASTFYMSNHLDFKLIANKI